MNSIENIAVLGSIGIFYIGLLACVYKCRMPFYIPSKKQKVSCIIVIFVACFIFAVQASGYTDSLQGSDLRVYKKIFETLTDIFHDDCHVLYLMYALVFIVPGGTFIALAMHQIMTKYVGQHAQLATYLWISLVCGVFCPQENLSFESETLFFIACVAFYILGAIIFYGGSKKKIICLAGTMAMILIIIITTSSAYLSLIYTLIRAILFSAIFGVIMKYACYLRVTLKRIVAVLMLAGCTWIAWMMQ